MSVYLYVRSLTSAHLPRMERYLIFTYYSRNETNIGIFVILLTTIDISQPFFQLGNKILVTSFVKV